jgi:hypothetical protein
MLLYHYYLSLLITVVVVVVLFVEVVVIVVVIEVSFKNDSCIVKGNFINFHKERFNFNF